MLASVCLQLTMHRLRFTNALATTQAGAPDSRLLGLHLALVRAYPTQLLGAVNDVVFGQHGYTKMQRHGDPRDSLLSSVLERGQGSPAALAILYREVRWHQQGHLLAALRTLQGWHCCMHGTQASRRIKRFPCMQASSPRVSASAGHYTAGHIGQVASIYTLSCCLPVEVIHIWPQAQQVIWDPGLPSSHALVATAVS